MPRIENKKTYHAPKETTQRFAPVIDLSLQIETCCHTICYHKPASQVICQNATLKPGAVVGDGAIVLPHCTVTGAGCAHKRKQILRNIRSFGTLFPLHGGKKHIEWASARVPPTPLLGGWAEGGWSISSPATSQILYSCKGACQ